MFNTAKTAYKIYKPIKELDKYNQETITWEEVGEERVFISLNTHQIPAVNNAVFAQQCEWIGVVSAPSAINQGYRVGNYEVVFAIDAGRERFLYLKDYGRNK